MSRSLTERFFLGLVGYAYVQLTADRGAPQALGGFDGRALALGPQVGYTFDVGGVPFYTNLRGCFEFGVERLLADSRRRGRW